jgi:hypothetical protein
MNCLRPEATQKLSKPHLMISNPRQSLVKGERLVRNDMRPVLKKIKQYGSDTTPSKLRADSRMK